MPGRWAVVKVSPARLAQLVISSLALGLGVALLLLASLGSDGYSTFVNGMARQLGVTFFWVNLVVGVVLVSMAWSRGLTPGLGTIIQPLLVGLTVSPILAAFDTPSSLAARVGLLLAGFAILVPGIAGYLGSRTGAGPVEAAALAFDPPVPFRWSYTVLQCSGALTGWLLGAAAGVGTLIVIVLIGPSVDLVARRVPAFGTPTPRRIAQV